jgi:hypothetical protein
MSRLWSLLPLLCAGLFLLIPGLAFAQDVDPVGSGAMTPSTTRPPSPSPRSLNVRHSTSASVPGSSADGHGGSSSYPSASTPAANSMVLTSPEAITSPSSSTTSPRVVRQ